MNKYLNHFNTIRIHRKYVCQMCFKMGIPLQGLVHDLSKYSLAEFSIAKYYTGTRSPHQVCRETIGYSPSWIHHYHRNKHHFQYFWDEDELGNIIPMKMPYKYVIESFCDMVGAGKAYMKDKWTPSAPLDYYIKCCKDKRIMNSESIYLLEKLLWNLKELDSLDKFFNWYNSNKDFLKTAYETNNYKDNYLENQ